MTRKHTKFEVCDRHAGWQGYGRYRLAEFFCEGGDGHPCSGGLCRCWPGTDLFCESICNGGELPYNWERFAVVT